MNCNRYFLTVALLILTIATAGCPNSDGVRRTTALRTVDSSQIGERNEFSSLGLVAVFKHHPTILENMDARNEDYNLILVEINKSGLAVIASDDLLLLDSNDIGIWRKLVADNQNRFKHYVPFEIDSNGFGFLEHNESKNKPKGTSSHKQE